MEFWQRHDYTSLAVSMEASSSEEESETEGSEEEFQPSDPSEREIHYVVGDVTRPHSTGDGDAIVVHCVGKP